MSLIVGHRQPWVRYKRPITSLYLSTWPWVVRFCREVITARYRHDEIKSLLTSCWPSSAITISGISYRIRNWWEDREWRKLPIFVFWNAANKFTVPVVIITKTLFPDPVRGSELRVSIVVCSNGPLSRNSCSWRWYLHFFRLEAILAM